MGTLARSKTGTTRALSSLIWWMSDYFQLSAWYGVVQKAIPNNAQSESTTLRYHRKSRISTLHFYRNGWMSLAYSDARFRTVGNHAFVLSFLCQIIRWGCRRHIRMLRRA